MHDPLLYFSGKERTIFRNPPEGRFFKGITFHMSRLTNYLRDTAAEMKRVSWPTQQQAVVYTALVIGISVVVALLLSAFDVVFTRALDLVV